jgi:hypothetical protein
MRIEEGWEDEDESTDPSDPSDPSWASPYIDGAWFRSASPNSADGELQNIAAFGTGLTRLSGPRRLAARIVVWAILFGFALTLLYGVVGIVRIW